MFPGPLRAFHETVQAGSIRKAADKLGLAPSSVSRQIGVLESLMGTSLFQRGLTGLSLTHAGALVAEYAQATVMDFDTLRQDLNDLRGDRGLIRVGAVESIIGSGPVAAAAEFRKSFQGAAFEFHVLPAGAVVEAILAKRLDIGISFCPEPTPGIVHEATIIEPLMLVVAPDHPLAGSVSLKLKALEGYDLALPDANFGVRRLLERAAHTEGVRLAPVINSNSFEALRDFARSRGGATILPLRAIHAETNGLVAVALDHPVLSTTTLELIRLQHWRMPRLVRLYMEALRLRLILPVSPAPVQLGPAP